MTNKDQNQAAVSTDKSNATDQQQNNTAKEKTTQEKSVMLKTEIKKTWDKLSDDDVNLYDNQPDLFFARVKDKHGVSREDAQKRLEDIQAACKDTCNKDKKTA